MLMMLGDFLFSLRTTPAQELNRATEWRQPSTSRVNNDPLSQFTGRGNDTISATGTLYPQLTGGPVHLERLRRMADTGAAWWLVAGDGRVLGTWKITRLTEGKKRMFEDGTARQIDFTLDLKRQPNDSADRLGGVVAGMLP
ncbi:phage tail protein [Guyparkeria halopsychrophila]|uniref:phage tail protein n=1 Tax=Guyparkeria halopsychrophila TaxID=3139421 RepID=UPI0037C9D38F